jgi:MFS family permease
MEKKDSYRFVIAALVTLVRICVGLVWASAGPLLPLMMQEYNINRGTVSWYVSSVPIIMAVLTVPVGIVGARLGLKKIFAVGAFLQAAGILAPFCTSYPLLFLTRVAFAVGTAITVPMASAVVAGWFTSRELPLVNGVIMSFVTLGNTFSYIATIPIATVISWKAPITIYGAFALTCATAWFIFGKERRKEPITLTQGAIAAIENKPEFSLKQALLQKSTLIFAFTLLGPFCCSNALTSWLPSYYNEVFKIPLDKASSMTSIFTVTGAIACILGGILPMRLGRRKPFLIIPGMFMGLIALACISFNNDWIIYASIAVFGIVNNIQAPSIFTIPMELPNMTPRTGAVVLAFCLGIGNFGGFLGPVIVGYLTDMTGSYWPGFLICFAMSFSLLVGGLLLPETGPKARKPVISKAVTPAMAK